MIRKSERDRERPREAERDRERRSETMATKHTSTATPTSTSKPTTATATMATVTTAMKPRQQHVRVGVGVLIKDPRVKGNFFCGVRKGSHGAGTLALPGGHLEMMESWEECAIREVKEETDLDIHTPVFGHVTNDRMPTEGKHYVTIFMMAECVSQDATPTNMEPHKCEGWGSYSWKELKEQEGVNQATTSNERGEKPTTTTTAKGCTTTKAALFGPLKKLVEEEPRTILNFVAK